MSARSSTVSGISIPFALPSLSLNLYPSPWQADNFMSASPLSPPQHHLLPAPPGGSGVDAMATRLAEQRGHLLEIYPALPLTPLGVLIGLVAACRPPLHPLDSGRSSGDPGVRMIPCSAPAGRSFPGQRAGRDTSGRAAGYNGLQEPHQRSHINGATIKGGACNG